MIIFLLLTLLLILALPLTIKKIEDNLGLFLFIMSLIALTISGGFSKHFILEIFTNRFIYMITVAVFIGGFLFRALNNHILRAVNYVLTHIPLRVFVFILTVFLGLISSFITAIIAAIFLIEIVEILPVNRDNKIKITILSCFSIGFGAALTPIGEPLSTIVATKLQLSFWHLFNNLGIYIIPAILLIGLISALYGKRAENPLDNIKSEVDLPTNTEILVRVAKVFVFIIALEMLGKGFTPLVAYIISLNANFLYWINLSSAVLDNATLAAAEISPKMASNQITAILLGLIISGGMMIPGNIPNIISAGKLKIKSSEWMRFGIPLGLSIMLIFYIILFLL